MNQTPIKAILLLIVFTLSCHTPLFSQRDFERHEFSFHAGYGVMFHNPPTLTLSTHSYQRTLAQGVSWDGQYHFRPLKRFIFGGIYTGFSSKGSHPEGKDHLWVHFIGTQIGMCNANTKHWQIRVTTGPGGQPHATKHHYGIILLFLTSTKKSTMKKYILILFSIISLWSCKETEDESIDITVLPSATTTGANTFGCLMDGWIYVGGRYLNWGHSYVWTYDSFHYYTEEDKLSVSVSVKPGINLSFTILSPQEGKESTITDIEFGREELEDGTAFISRFDTEMKIISVTFGNGKRLTNGRFDIHYTEHNSNTGAQS